MIGDHDVVTAEFGYIFEAVLPVVDEDAQLRCETDGFATPVFEETCGANDECRRRTLQCIDVGFRVSALKVLRGRRSRRGGRLRIRRAFRA